MSALGRLHAPTRRPMTAVQRWRALGLQPGVRPLHKLPRQRPRGASVGCQLEGEGEGAPSFQQLPQPRKTARLEPNFYLSQEDAVECQLKALQHCNFPYADHGIEVLYRFAAFDPFQRSNYFGRSLDLGQFERFRRIFYTPCYACLVNHTSHSVLSSLELAEGKWRFRVLIQKQFYQTQEEHVYEFTMVQRFGGRRDGFWYTDSLICDGCDDRHLLGII